jgi:Winged helix DNA-binding domain
LRRIDPNERRARLARRHRLAPGQRARDVVEAARSMVCLHGTNSSTVFLSTWARVEGMTVPDLDRALYADRSLVKHLAMRRTLFVFPRETLSAAQAGASDRVAAAERRRLVRHVENAGLFEDGERWLADASKEVLAALTGGREATSSELRAEIPLLEGSIVYGEGKSWGGRMSVAPRVLTTLAAAGQVVRASNDGVWTANRPRWASMESWLGEEIPRCSEAEGVARLVEAWLRAFGPGTEADIKWWLGSTFTSVRRALADLGALDVELEGEPGHVLADDVEAVEPVEPWAALLPTLDPTTMGWKERDWYLGPHASALFDSAGNAGPTVWWDGRVVGGWSQRRDGEISYRLLEDVGSDAKAAVEAEAGRLEAWLGDVRLSPGFLPPFQRALTG